MSLENRGQRSESEKGIAMAEEASIPNTSGAGGTDVQNETPGGGDPGGVDASSIPNASGAGATDPRDQTPGGGDPGGVDASSIPNTTGAGDA